MSIKIECAGHESNNYHRGRLLIVKINDELICNDSKNKPGCYIIILNYKLEKIAGKLFDTYNDISEIINANRFVNRFKEGIIIVSHNDTVAHKERNNDSAISLPHITQLNEKLKFENINHKFNFKYRDPYIMISLIGKEHEPICSFGPRNTKVILSVTSYDNMLTKNKSESEIINLGKIERPCVGIEDARITGLILDEFSQQSPILLDITDTIPTDRTGKFKCVKCDKLYDTHLKLEIHIKLNCYNILIYNKIDYKIPKWTGLYILKGLTENTINNIFKVGKSDNLKERSKSACYTTPIPGHSVFLGYFLCECNIDFIDTNIKKSTERICIHS